MKIPFRIKYWFRVKKGKIERYLVEKLLGVDFDIVMFRCSTTKKYIMIEWNGNKDKPWWFRVWRGTGSHVSGNHGQGWIFKNYSEEKEFMKHVKRILEIE